MNKYKIHVTLTVHIEETVTVEAENDVIAKVKAALQINKAIKMTDIKIETQLITTEPA